MVTVHQEAFRIPGWVKDLDSFRRWACSDDFPEKGRVSYFNGDFWVDMSMERRDHNLLKGQIVAVLTLLVVQRRRLGEFHCDGMRLVNPDVGLSTEPDGMFLSNRTLRAGKAQLLEGDESLEVVGTPDMVLEVVSPTSVQKDTEFLPDLYWQAGVREYWLVNPLGEEITFDILRHTARAYVAAPRSGGWVKSAVFGKSFRLTRRLDAAGLSLFRLAVR